MTLKQPVCKSNVTATYVRPFNCKMTFIEPDKWNVKKQKEENITHDTTNTMLQPKIPHTICKN